MKEPRYDPGPGRARVFRQPKGDAWCWYMRSQHGSMHAGMEQSQPEALRAAYDGLRQWSSWAN